MKASGKVASQIQWGLFSPLFGPSLDPTPFLSHNLPQLIQAQGIDAGNVNVILGSVYKLPFPTAFKTLLGSTMALWAGSAPDLSAIKHHGLDQLTRSSMASWTLSLPPLLPMSAQSDFQLRSPLPPAILTHSSPPPFLTMKMLLCQITHLLIFAP